ncbi:MAG: hypothetical protein MUF18_15245 [Fimbriiglobus sp.]|nr:hypothetical protein [Fimbriiglobus sp.]
MRRMLAVVCGLAALGGVGCQNFSYVQRDAQGGVIEVKASEREGALAKLRQQEGEIEIVMEQPKSKPGGPFNPSAPPQMSERMASTTTSGFGALTASTDDKVQIQYKKKPMGMAGGLPPAPKDDGLVPAGYQSKSSYERPTGAGMATVGGAKSSTALPKPDMPGGN